MTDDKFAIQILFLKEQITEIKAEQKELQKDVKELLAFVHEAKGGKKWIFALVSLSVSLGVLITQAISYLK